MFTRRERIQKDLVTALKEKGPNKKHPVKAPADPPDPLDALHTIAHRANDIGVNVGHARNHVVNMMRFLKAGDKDAALWNADHAQKHMMEIESIAKKLADHIREHPGLAKEYERLQKDNPFNKVLP